ncbi:MULTISPECIES: CRISPR-associated endonuclease Cas2 [Pseudothermotoga]|uniref:CRISPR-associated endoribonuclease Cas2 n=1 Tax=Pseudothermotoga lettingae (strain ATCC BAA-301 / DSM 14385 / NBRC 107922 / TMO) TaxID=416591 RepID=A8F3P3_PSELT|nr:MULTISPECIES: CRISPR-associated endonuclease Cas2 [Pseudothermotoga]ABV32777.1 CRISPR-associated protein Cas2 [Pseudothermotoga lettingae TMO]KUK20561.1 MAG: CRISPR-associated endoribonuclease Cas2 [Pseudothermotoga lettingae]MDI3495031.1 CRISPR-associated protein Cas2 [Pseudothermotoga sp.]MDK2885213.1 CRISPR-associated protein Cas2 [Pseudothermotoga sp.]GLI48229.1 CRISPR-associated endoribonuclease Cas2 [Pseudothermotoga lettingae TMO]
MYLIVTYDVGEKRVARVLKVCRKYLNWVQNSVLEGEITIAKFEKLKLELERSIDKSEDSVRIYILKNKSFFDLKTLGNEKGTVDIIY